MIESNNTNPVTDISEWEPDYEKIRETEQFKSEHEWKRKSSLNSSKILKPSEIGIDGYKYSKPLHPKFYEGRYPPPVALESSENIEWYYEQLRRCIYGFEYDNTRITGDYYWFLNFTPFLIAKKDSLGNPTTDFDTAFPYHSAMAEYTFKLIEEAHSQGKAFMWMAGRGVGKDQPNSEPVLTPYGFTTIGKLQVGNKVISKDGYSTTVTAVFPQGEKEIYKLVLADGRSVKCGIEHIWNIYDPVDPNKALTTLQILNSKEDLYLPIGKGIINKDKILMISPVILGEAYVGDVTYDNIEQDNKELKLSSSIKAYLEAFRLTNDTPVNKRKLPIKVLSLGFDQRLKLLKTIIRKIGTFNERLNTYSIDLLSANRCNEILNIARSVGLHSYKFGKTVLKIISNRQLGFIKHTSISEEANKVKILGVIKCGYKEESTCISVDNNSQTYITTDYVVTHNTYMILSIIAKVYHLKPQSLSFISASGSSHATEAFNKMVSMIDAIGVAHPTISLARLRDTSSLLMSGHEVTRDGVKYREGHRSSIEKKIYGDNPGVTKGSRPDIQLLEEIGAWASGPGNLKDCISNSLGSWRVGTINKCRVFMIGTGGSVTSDQAKAIHYNPDAYNCLPVHDFKKKSCYFLPADYSLGGAGWERTGVNNNEYAKQFLEKERERLISDAQLYRKVVQEYPFTAEEAFKKMGSNNFNQYKLADQYVRITSIDPDIKRPIAGFLEWKRKPNGEIIGVTFNRNPEGDIEILEMPYSGPDGEKYKDLYVMGVDSIDQGNNDSSVNTEGSKIAALVKKRIINGAAFSTTSSIYVAKYLKRSDDVRDDYENVLKLAVFYDCRINLEYTKIGIVAFFRERKQYSRFMKRPISVLPNDKGMSLYEPEKMRNQIGTPASTEAIAHQDNKIKEYIDDYYYQIFFPDLLEQLRDYDPEDRRKYDLVIAMGLTELGDEDYLGAGAEKEEKVLDEIELWGWYTDPVTGYKKHGILPKSNGNSKKSLEQQYMEKYSASPSVRYYDRDGTPHY